MSSARVEVSATLSISVVGATGRGPTSLAAFDHALRAVGVANFNLVRLSSVIPPGSSVEAGSVEGSERAGPSGRFAPTHVDLRSQRSSTPQGGWGDRLYAVWAFSSAQLLGEEAWAGVAWAQDPRDGRGLFVEHEGASEAQVRSELDASLQSICAARGMQDFERSSVVVGTRCEGEPVGALVIAPYQAEPWAPSTSSWG